MYILSLTYVKPLEYVEKYLAEHNRYLETFYQSGHFICSGRKVPRVGGVILAKAESQEKIQKIIAEDPFFIHEVASYDIIEFIPTKSANGLAAFIS